MADINNIVQVIIRLQTGGATKTGFGTTLIASAHSLFTDRVQFFSDLDGLGDVGADGTHGTLNGLVYNAAQTAFAQNPSPNLLAIGRIQVSEVLVSIDDVVEGFEYTVTLQGIDYSHTAAALEDSDDIATALAVLLDAVSGFDSAAIGGGSGDLTVTAAPIIDFTLTVGDKITASANVVEDFVTGLGLIKNENENWYGVTATTRTESVQEDIADWVEALDSPKFFRYANDNTDGPDVSVASDLTSIWVLLKAKSYDRSEGFYHSLADGTINDQWIDVAMSAVALGFDPDVETATDKFKTLKGISPDTLTATQRLNLIGTEDSPTSGKNANVYTTIAGESIVQSGITASGEWADLILGADWLKVRIEERIFRMLVVNPKVPYTNAGIQALVGEIRAQLLIGQGTGFLAFDAELDETFGALVTAPAIEGVPTVDKANRILKQLSFKATAAGAIHAVKPIVGTLAP